MSVNNVRRTIKENLFGKNMNRKFLSLVIVFFFSAVSVNQADAQDADSIVKKYIKAIGGYKKLMKIKTLQMTGVYSEGKYNFNSTILWKRPKLRLVIVGDSGSAYLEGYNGKSWEYSQSDKKLKFTEGAASNAARRGAEFDESLVNWRKKGYKLRFIGREQVLGKDCFHIQITLDDGFNKDYYLDTKTYLIAALRKAMPLHAQGEDIVSLSTYDDYRPVAGILYPHAFIEKKFATGEIMNTLKWTKIEANVEIDDGRFNPPEKN